MARSQSVEVLGKEIKKSVNETIINAIASTDTSKATAQGFSVLSKNVEQELRTQLDSLDERLSALENGGNFKTLGSDLEKISVEFINKYTDTLQNLVQNGLQGVSLDLEPLKEQMAGFFKKAFSDFGKFKPYQVDKNEAIKTLTQNKYFSDFKKWQEDGTASNFNKRKEFDKELIRNLELRNASLNVAYYDFIEKYAKELEGIQLSFEDFLNMDVDLFRGAQASQKYANGRLASFTPLRDVAKGFAQSKGDALYSVKMKMEDTLGAPGVVLGDNGEEIEILIQMDKLIDKDNKLSEDLMLAKNEGKKFGLQGVKEESQDPSFMSEEFVQKLKQISDERIQSEKDLARQEKENRDNYLKHLQEITEAKLKQQQEEDRNLFESDAFKKAEKQYPWLNKIQERQELGEDTFHLENLSNEDISSLNKLYDERLDLEIDFTGDNSAYIALNSLKTLLQEIKEEAQKDKVEISNLLTASDFVDDTKDVSSSQIDETINSQENAKVAIDETTASLEKQSEVAANLPKASTTKQVQAQQDYKQATEQANTSLKEQQTLSSHTQFSGTEKEVQQQKELKQVAESTSAALEEQQKVTVTASTSSVDQPEGQIQRLPHSHHAELDQHG